MMTMTPHGALQMTMTRKMVTTTTKSMDEATTAMKVATTWDLQQQQQLLHLGMAPQRVLLQLLQASGTSVVCHDNNHATPPYLSI